jgi:competence protein ComGC
MLSSSDRGLAAGNAWSRKNQKRRQAGLSVPEIFVMVAVVSIGAAIFVPKYTKTQAESKRQLCVVNLKSLDTAVQQWAIEAKVNSKSTYVLNTNKILSYIKDSKLPECPSGGTYLAGATVAKPPVCTHSADGHSL